MIGTCLQQRYDIQTALSQRKDRLTYLAWDKLHHCKVVVKVLPFSYGFDWSQLDRFERETNLLKQLSHPAIPDYIDGFEIDLPDFKGFAWVQAYVEAESLASAVQKGRTFSEADIKQIAEDLLQVMMFLHERNPPVIHRDIKPSNILIANRSGHSCGHIYLIDFDAIQTRINALEGTVTVAGTFGYGAPEQFRGEAVPASDLYGLGMTLIYLLTGVNPAHLPTHNGRVKFKGGDISESLNQWIRGLTQPDTHRRFQSAKGALMALHSQHFELGQLSASTLRPADTRIVLIKTEDTLTIKLPNTGFRFDILWEIVKGFILISMFCWVIIVPIIGWFIAYLIGSSFLKTIRSFFRASFGRTQLIITEQETSLILRCGIFSTYNTVETTLIHKIEQVLPHVVGRRSSEASSGVLFDRISSELLIHAGNQTLEIAEHTQNLYNFRFHGLTLAEQEWIASELSDWFDLPIEKRDLQVVLPK